jgi:hypothetical protein|nr:MAG TPA: hypothetical protein [Caudoviricetes sp.]
MTQYDYPNYYTRSFEDSYQDLHDSLIDSKIVTSDLDVELIPFVYTVYDLVAFDYGFDREELLKYFKNWIDACFCSDKVYSIFYERHNLYSEIVRGKRPRYEWMIGNPTNIESSAILNLCAAFGDILYNPTCANNYDKAPIMIHGFSEAIDFTATMTKFSSKVMNTFYEALSLFEKSGPIEAVFKNDDKLSTHTENTKSNNYKKEATPKEKSKIRTSTINNSKNPSFIDKYLEWITLGGVALFLIIIFIISGCFN